MLFAILSLIFVLSILTFIMIGLDKRRTVIAGSPLPLGLLITGAIIAPFGVLMGMLLFNDRLKSLPLLLISIGMTILWPVLFILL